MKFQPDARPSKWGATAAIARGATLEAAVDLLASPGSHPFDGLVRLSDVTEVKGYRYLLTQVSLDFGHPAFGGAADLLDEMGGSEFQLIIVQTPEGDLYLIIDKDNLPEEEAKPDHPLLQQLAKWLGKALAR